MTRPEIIVFAGPSLPQPCEAERHLPVQRLGPAAQGDVLRAAMLHPRAIVLIDGYFEAYPAVYHKEILWALDAGIPVYGAASTGALRAAELQAFGMIGIGEIFQAFAHGTLDRDDEVALIHAPKEVGYAYLSQPLVNIRWTLTAAVEARVLPPDTATQLLDHAAQTFYPDRTYTALLSHCAEVDPDAHDRLHAWLPDGKIDQKNRDALACLSRVAADMETGQDTVQTDFKFQHSDAFESLLQEVLSNADPNDPDVLERMRVAMPDRFELLRRSAESAELALALERVSTLPMSGADLAREVTEFRQAHGLHDQAALMQWLTSHNLDIDALSQQLEQNARIARARRSVGEKLDDRMRNLLMFAGGTQNDA